MAHANDHGRQHMLHEQLQQRGIRDQAVLRAMATVPREQFVDRSQAEIAYRDAALPIECGQTISQPYMVAKMTELLELSAGQRVLEIGTGSGYQAAILAELGADVFTIERHPHLARQAADRLNTFYPGRVKVLIGDGTLGWLEASPFERIIVTAASPQVPPALLEQLALNGRLVIPVGPADEQSLNLIKKDSAGKLRTMPTIACRFVPLLGEAGFPAALAKS